MICFCPYIHVSGIVELLGIGVGDWGWSRSSSRNPGSAKVASPLSTPYRTIPSYSARPQERKVTGERTPGEPDRAASPHGMAESISHRGDIAPEAGMSVRYQTA